jgi:hypothetical protein
MSGLDRIQFANELQSAAYSSFMRTYDAEPAVYSQICEVRDITEGSQLWYGDKEIIYTGMSDYRERQDGARYENDKPILEGISQARMRQFSRSHTIPWRQLASISAGEASRQVTNLADQVVADWGGQAVREFDGLLADSLEAGALAAGSLEFYDNTYLDNIDPHPGFIYDGKALFASDHPLQTGTRSNINVSAALTQANLNAAVTQMYGTNAVDFRGRRVRDPSVGADGQPAAGADRDEARAVRHGPRGVDRRGEHQRGPAAGREPVPDEHHGLAPAGAAASPRLRLLPHALSAAEGVDHRGDRRDHAVGRHRVRLPRARLARGDRQQLRHLLIG